MWENTRDDVGLLEGNAHLSCPTWEESGGCEMYKVLHLMGLVLLDLPFMAATEACSNPGHTNNNNNNLHVFQPMLGTYQARLALTAFNQLPPQAALVLAPCTLFKTPLAL